MEKTKKDVITIIGQVYNEEVMLPLYYEEFVKFSKKMNQVDFELIFIDDCSKDKSLEIIKGFAKKDKRIKFISMSRNFGREACAMAGFKYASGNLITTMDIDLQDPFELLIKMYDSIKNKGYDIAAAKALTRKGYSKFHKFCTNMFFKVSNKISTVKMLDGQREYRLMTKQVVDAILEHNEYNLFNKGLLNDVGFKIDWIEYENVERKAGDTKFPYKRMINYAVTGLIDYSVFPLKSIFYVGSLLLFAALILLILTIIFAICSVDVNFTILILSLIMTILSGIILVSLGVMALYLAQIHLEVKKRPLYIIREKNIGETNEK